MRHERTMRLEKVDENGFFPMTFATEGEASDGDILSIKGGQIPKRFSLLEDHNNSAGKKVGSVDQPQKDLKHAPPLALGRGQIELDGHGDRVENRRDLAHMINKHGGAVSVRWDEVDGGKPPKRRTELPPDHPHFVASDDPSWRKRNGFFWPSWKALEVSVVALGADGAAVIGGRTYVRKDGSDEFELQADDARQEPDYGERHVEPCNLEQHRTAGDSETGDELIPGVDHLSDISSSAALARDMGVSATDLINAVTLESDSDEDEQWANTCSEVLSELATTARNARSFGAEPHDIANTVALSEGSDEFSIVTIGDEEVFLPQRLADQLAEEREARAETTAQEPEPDPEPAPRVADQRPAQTLGFADLPEGISSRDVSTLLSRMLDEHETNIIRRARAMIDARTGKVGP